MPPDLEFTGERFVPGAALGEIVYEHVHRYAFAQRFAAGRRVLDAACGEGYGSALLAQAAASVIGVDIEASAIAHATARYAGRPSLRFVAGSVTALPLADASVDLVVSFETIEHLSAQDQPRMLAEFARVLAPDGLLVISSPNRREYSDARDYRNPFHLHELDRDGLASLLDAFPARRWYRQRLWMGSTIWSEHDDGGHEAWSGGSDHVEAAAAPEAMYFLVLAAREERFLPGASRVSLFSDEAETELKRAAHHASEWMRLDRLAGERLAMLDRQMLNIQHLERQVAEREQQLAVCRSTVNRMESDAGALAAERDRLERALAAQERLIAYRQSARWWLQMPWFRVRLLWHRWRGT
jgi:SAM-dependent methyltransferase